MRTRPFVAATLASALLACGIPAGDAPLSGPAAPPRQQGPTAIATDEPAPSPPAVAPKPVPRTVARGLAWLAGHQLSGGGWGQGDEAPGMSNGAVGQRDAANVADTSMAVLAFVRAGHTASRVDYQDVVRRGIEHVLTEVEASDAGSLFVTQVRGTRVQGKIGTYADTFAALMMLTEAKGTMRDGVANARLERALRKVVTKIEKNQRPDGRWDDRGWAPVLSQAMAAKGVNRAAQAGVAVDDKVLERVEAAAVPSAAPPVGTAGVELYGAAAGTSAARDSATTRKVKAEEMKDRAAGKKPRRPSGGAEAPDAPTAAQVAEAERRAAASESQAAKVEQALLDRLDEPAFVSGFGNNGGEEFLSYMLISETLRARGGAEWSRWDAAMAQLVGGVQNDDGSWTGHHCITGRTFCTAAAILVLLADRAPVGAKVAIAR
jgi:hypothetical protein